MIYFNNDYAEGCHPKVLEALNRTNLEQTPGYGEDAYCQRAAAKIRTLCKREDAAVHFLVGGTQTNLTVIDAALRPHQGALCAQSGHIHVHETGAVEATGHKVLALPSEDGKITAAQVRQAVETHRRDGSFEHMVQPKLVYISNPTELGTLYTLSALEALSDTCRELGLYLFLDGARLGYGLMARGNDVTLPDLARLCDVFYIGGTKVGALFGEAVVITHPALKEDFRYLIKQHGGMLAKGRLLGVQFDALMTDNLYFDIAARADALADKLRDTMTELQIPFLVPGVTNQLFPILTDTVLAELAEKYVFCEQQRVDDSHRAVRFCTSWATREENVDALCADLKRILGRN
ncbi:MAG: threonine aldolase family protein [Faecousia sp.]